MKNKIFKTILFAVALFCVAKSMNAQCPTDGLFITEFVYDVCDDSDLADGSSNGGEYFILTNTSGATIDLQDTEFDDDGNSSDGNGLIISPGTTLNLLPGASIVIAAIPQTTWEAEYGALPSGLQFYDSTGSTWQSLNNGGDNISVSGACNEGAYTDLVGEGEVVLWDGSNFVAGGVVSVHASCGPQTYVPGSNASMPAPCTITDIELSNISECNDQGTTSDSDDTFTADVTITFSNAPATGNLILSGDALSSNTVSASGLTGATGYQFTGVLLPASGSSLNLIAAFSADVDCYYSEFPIDGLEPCSEPCPDYSALTVEEMEVTVTESTCTELGGDQSGGVIEPLDPSPCPDGSTLYYSINYETFTTEVPEYRQNTPMTIITRCQCDENSGMTGPLGVVETEPGDCPTCVIKSMTATNFSPCINVGGDEDGENDIFTADITIEYCDLPPDGYLYIDVGDGGEGIDIADIGPTTHTFTSVSLDANGYPISLAGTASGDWRCDYFVENVGTAPFNCSTCATILSVQNIGACQNGGDDENPDNDFYTVDLVITHNDMLPATGFIEIYFGPSLNHSTIEQIPVGSIGASPFIITGVQYPADGNTYQFESIFTEDEDCRGYVTFESPSSCSSTDCSITDISTSNISACSDVGTNADPTDDTFTGDVTVTFANAPTTGTLELTGAGNASVAVGSLGSATSHTFTGVSMPANGSSISLTAAFSAELTCTFSDTDTGIAPASCSASLACDISIISTANMSACSDGGTDSDSSDDTFTLDVTITFANAPGTGTLDLTGDGTASVAVGSLTSATSHIFTGVQMAADGTPISLSASFSADGTCAIGPNIEGTAPSACSDAVCTLPEVTIVATCTNDDTGEEAGENEYYIKFEITSLGSHSSGNDEVVIDMLHSGGGTTYNIASLGTFYDGPFTHSGSGTFVNAATYRNDGESCSGVIAISEILCGYETDEDGTSDGESDDDLHASGPACDCMDDSEGFLLAQVAPGSFDPATTVMVYILVDSNGDIVTFNNTGLFTALSNDTYNIYPYNVITSDLSTFTSSIPATGDAYSDFMPPSGSCSEGCGSAAMVLDCDCRVDDVAIQKVVVSTGPFSVGDKVIFNLIAYNQGDDPVYNVALVDYIPAGLDFFAADNTATDFASSPDTPGGGTVSTTVATTTPIAGGGSGSYTTSIVLTINSSAATGASLVNNAEITGATQDEDGDMPIEDEDDDLANTGGGTEDDNNIDDDTMELAGDEDDFDFAAISLCGPLDVTVDSPVVCKGTTSAPVNSVIIDGSPVHMLLAYDDPAFADVWALGLLDVTGESHVIPAGLAEGIYHGQAYFYLADGCELIVPFTITINCPECGVFPWDGSK